VPKPKKDKAMAHPAIDQNSHRRNITKTVVEQSKYDGGEFDFGASYDAGSLDRVIASLLKIRESIPSEYRANAFCEIGSYMSHDNSYATIEIGYSRPETDAEMDARIGDDEARRIAMESNERAVLARLQEKYGGSKSPSQTRDRSE